jgi:O-antigen ligase
MFLILAALAGVFLAGSIRQGSTGIFLAVAGAAMVFLSPNRVVPWRYWLLCGGLMLSASLSLLPQAWFHTPLWRVGLQENQGLPPLLQVSLAPRETIYWMLLLAGALLTGLFSLGHPVRSGVKISLALLGALGCAAYALLALHAKKTGWEYPFTPKNIFAPPDFGFFPNRNHTAAFLVTGAVLSLGIVRTAWMEKRPIAFVLGAAVMGVCSYALLFESTSRGGVVFLLAGLLVWLAMLGRGHRSSALVVSVLAVGFLVAGIFFSTESQARDRVLEFFGVSSMVSESGEPKSGAAFSDFRSKIFRDSVKIVRDYPITGTGLGTYSYVVPFYVDASIDEAIPIHPESDWLMTACESGLLFLLCAFGLLVVLIRDMLAFRRSATWPLRWGIISALLAAILHAIVDVPIHRVELGWWILVLGGLAFGNPAPTGTERNKSWWTQRLIFGAGGAGCLALGLLLIRSQWFGEVPFPPYRAAIAVNQMRQLVEKGLVVEATNLARSEIPLSPMSTGLYRELGYREIKNGGDPIVAEAVFAAERALNPVSAKLAFDQGLLWIGDDPKRTARLWVESMKRHLRIQKGGAYSYPEELFGRMLGQARTHPEMLPILEECSRMTPSLWMVWIGSTSPEKIEQAATNKDFLATLDAPARQKFLQAWWNRGNKDSLEKFLAENPDWEDAAWGLRVRQMLTKKEFQRAVEAAQKRYEIDLNLPKLTPEQLAQKTPPPGLAESVAYYTAQGNHVSARRLIAESLQAKEAEGFRLQCALAVQVGDWPTAWKAMEGLLSRTNRANLP